MTTSDSSAVRPQAALWPRLASFLSIVPLGVWTVLHLWNNLSAFRGAAQWQQAVTTYPSPFAEALAFVVVMTPLVLHTLWGLQRLVSFQPNNVTYRYYGNLKYILQRAAGLGVLVFLGAHIWLAFLRPHLLMNRPEPFHELAREMNHHLPTLIVYLLGTLGVAYHLANGISGFCWTWGLVAGRNATATLDRLTILLFLILVSMAWGSIYALYTAGAAFG